MFENWEQFFQFRDSSGAKSPWRSAEIGRFEMNWDFSTININLHFWRLTVKNKLFWRLTIEFWAVWRLAVNHIGLLALPIHNFFMSFPSNHGFNHFVNILRYEPVGMTFHFFFFPRESPSIQHIKLLSRLNYNHYISDNYASLAPCSRLWENLRFGMYNFFPFRCFRAPNCY